MAVLRKRPVRAEAYYILGACDEAEAKIDAAITHYQDALVIDPGLASASVHLATLLLDGGRYEDAARVARAGLLRLDVPELHLALATALERVGEHDQAGKVFAAAADSFARAVAKRPDDALLRSRFGRALLVTGDDDGARREFTRAMETAADRPDNVDVFEEAGIGFSTMGDPKACVRALDRALSVSSAGALSRKRAQLFRERAECRYRAKDLSGARADARASLDLEPNLQLHLSAARWDEQAGDKIGCARHYAAAVGLAPSPKIAQDAKLGEERCK